jgi:hypothetical protein
MQTMMVIFCVHVYCIFAQNFYANVDALYRGAQKIIDIDLADS